MPSPTRAGTSDVARRQPKALGKILVACNLVAMLLPHVVKADDGTLEFAVKAAFVTKFIPFVGWPNGALASAGGVFRICVAGRDPFGDLLDRAADRQSIAGFPVTIRRVPVVARSTGCQVLYASGSPEQPVADMLAAVRGTPVLTLTDQATDPKSRGMINFIISDNRVRFEIDEAAAEQNGLTISSKLLGLATRVLGGR
jgi:YfiR/HmsC-like